MSRHRLYTPIELAEHTTVELTGPRAHYLATVLRARAGDNITLFDDSGREFRSSVDAVTRKKVTLTLGESSRPATESPLEVILLQSVIRSERMDFCVQKSTELGVTHLVPIFTERSVVKIPKERVEKRRSHWHNIAVSACEQSGRVRIPEVSAPLVLADAIRLVNDVPLLVLDPWAEAAPLHHTAIDSQRVALCVGPEGGFSDEELALLRQAGARAVTCGPRVLRSETAGVVAVAACQMRWGDWGETGKR